MADGNAPVIRSIEILQSDVDFLGNYTVDNVESINIPSTVEQTTVTQIKYNKWDEKKVEVPNEVKKDVQQKSEEINEASEAVDSLTGTVKILDQKVFDTITQINSLKSQIVSLVNTAKSGGCQITWPFLSTSSTPITISGVTVGFGKTVYSDTGEITYYPNLDDYSSDTPFYPEEQISLISSNLGKGSKTKYTLNDVSSGIGTYGTITGLTTLGLPSPTCSSYSTQINTLVSQINTLRNNLSTDLTNSANAIKEEKTQKELILWSYFNDEFKIDSSRTSAAQAINVIKTTPELQ
jgi:hypothetical protein